MVFGEMVILPVECLVSEVKPRLYLYLQGQIVIADLWSCVNRRKIEVLPCFVLFFHLPCLQMELFHPQSCYIKC